MVNSPADGANNLYKDVGEKLFKEQIDDLYDAIEKDDIATAGRIIGYIGDSKNLLALEPLAILLDHHDETVRSSSALAMGKIGDKTAIQPLIKALNDPSEKVKISIVTALGMFGDKSVIRALENIPLSPEEPKLTNAVRNVVYKIDHTHSLDTLGSETVPAPNVQATVADVPVPASHLKGVSPTVATQAVYEEKEPILAAVCSFFIPGLGQVYNGESYVKGFTYLAAMYIGYLFLIIPGLLVWIYGIYNAYTTANKINAGEVMTNHSSTVRVLIYAVAAFLIPIIITVILAAIIAAFIFSTAVNIPPVSTISPGDISSGVSNLQTMHTPAFTANRINDTAVMFVLQDMGGASSVDGFSIQSPMITDPTVIDSNTELEIGRQIIVNDSSLSGNVHIVATSLVDGNVRVVTDTQV